MVTAGLWRTENIKWLFCNSFMNFIPIYFLISFAFLFSCSILCVYETSPFSLSEAGNISKWLWINAKYCWDQKHLFCFFVFFVRHLLWSSIYIHSSFTSLSFNSLFQGQKDWGDTEKLFITFFLMEYYLWNLLKT